MLCTCKEATAEGPDKLPHWFLKIASPSIAAPLAYLFNLSLSSSYAPTQWKTVTISPVPKIPQPATCSDFRPISVSSILSRVMERLLVRSFLYPTFLLPHPLLSLKDQFAFRPTGSTTAAISAIVHTVTTLLTYHSYVHLIAFVMSKAFDTVWHSTLMGKLAALSVTDNI